MNLKQTLLFGAEFSGLNFLSRYFRRRRFLSLCYHSVISDDSPPNDARTRIAVTKSQFNEQLKELRKHWRPVSLTQIRNAIQNDIPLPDNAVHVSFDDGFRNNFTLAAPLLAQYEIPATIFVTTNLIGSVNQLFWILELYERLIVLPDSEIEINGETYQLPPPESPQRTEICINIINRVKRTGAKEQDFLLQKLRNKVEIDLTPAWKRELYEFLDWDEIRLLRKQGIEIGSHTVSHCILSNLDQTELNHELAESKKCIERELGTECESLAYPFGSAYDFSEKVVETAKRLGFRLAFTLQERRNAIKLDAMRLHRICIHREHTLNSFRALIAGTRNIF
ncbi:MAG: polysaccharide deacetylase family protein [Planctomycetaceae bacterium]|jgi:peptidoglycan/xylan/chitin deacetylase (PgdA/CDA1 family)|nr:polysaccharide deacetylase family protein [Planctomycetaceae bacterium]